MSEPIRIKRYPNRRFYAGHTRSYVSIADIEQLVREGNDVVIVDSQTGEDLTRSLLIQLIAERHPDKIAMFPTAMLHAMLRANSLVSTFLADYFRNSLAYLEYLHQHGASGALTQPVHWMKAWLDAWSTSTGAKSSKSADEKPAEPSEADLSARIAQLEQRLAELEKERP